MPIVCDASALVEVGLRTDRGRLVLDALRGNEAVAPDLVNTEVVSAFRRILRQRALTPERARRAIDLIARMDVRRVGTTGLMERMWAWRENLSAYDATYVALAETFSCPLVTADSRLAGAPGLSIPLVVV